MQLKPSHPLHHLFHSCRAVVLCTLLLCALPLRAQQNTTFLQASIEQALAQRDYFLYNLPSTTQSLFSPTPAVAELNELRSTLLQQGDATEPWHIFYLGVAHLHLSMLTSVRYFDLALQSASDDVGLSWLLYKELRRYQQHDRADSALAQLERLTLASGTMQEPQIAQQLLFEAHHTHETTRALRVLWWANRFDRSSLWPSVHQLLRALPAHPDSIQPALATLWYRLSNQWQTQAAAMLFTLDWLATTLSLFTALLFLVLLIKYLPTVIHPLQELFPSLMPMMVRQALIVLTLFSTLLLGPLLFLWISGIIVWPRLNRPERRMAIFALIILMLSPMHARIKHALQNCSAETAAPGLLSRALNEGPSPQLLRQIQKALRSTPEDELLLCATAVQEFKHDNLFRARYFAQAAFARSPHDPIVLQTHAIIGFHNGNGDLAWGELEAARKAYSTNPVTLYNWGTFLLKQMNSVEGMEFIAQASRQDKQLVNAFINDNNRHFSESLPLHRQFILPNYTPQQFWTTIAPRYWGDWESTASLWQSSFLGLSPITTQIVFVSLFLVLISFFSVYKGALPSLRSALFWAPPSKLFTRILHCEICKVAICSKCARGIYCRSCFSKLRKQHGDSEHLQQQLRKRATARRTFLTTALQVVIPRAGEVLSDKGGSVLFVLTHLLTSALYALLISVAGIQGLYPGWIQQRLISPIVGLCALGVAVQLLMALRFLRIKHKSAQKE